MNTHPIAPRIATFPTTYADVTDRKETWWTAHREIDISVQCIYIKYEIYFIYILNCVRVQYLSLHSIKGGVSDNLLSFFS